MTPLARNAPAVRRLGFPESAEGDGCPGTAPAGRVPPSLPAGAALPYPFGEFADALNRPAEGGDDGARRLVDQGLTRSAEYSRPMWTRPDRPAVVLSPDAAAGPHPET